MLAAAHFQRSQFLRAFLKGRSLACVGDGPSGDRGEQRQGGGGAEERSDLVDLAGLSAHKL